MRKSLGLRSLPVVVFLVGIVPLIGVGNQLQPVLIAFLLGMLLTPELSIKIGQPQLVPILAIVLISFFSCIWARDASLVWSISFYWLLLYLWYVFLVFGEYSIDHVCRGISVISLLGLIVMIAVLFIVAILNMFDGFEVLRDFRKVGYNTNYLAMYVYFLSTIALLSWNVLDRKLLTIITLFALALTAILFNSRGVLLGLLMILVSHITIGKRAVWSTVIASILVFSLAFFLIKNSGEYRLSFYHQAFEVFKNRPLLGLGVGNWEFAYSYGTYDHLGSYQKYFPRHQSHSLFLKTVIETGVVGGLVLIGLFFHTCSSAMKASLLKRRNYFGVILAFLLVSLFYNFHISEQQYFSQFQFGFITVAALSDKILRCEG